MSSKTGPSTPSSTTTCRLPLGATVARCSPSSLTEIRWVRGPSGVSETLAVSEPGWAGVWAWAATVIALQSSESLANIGLVRDRRGTGNIRAEFPECCLARSGLPSSHAKPSNDPAALLRRARERRRPEAQDSAQAVQRRGGVDRRHADRAGAGPSHFASAGGAVPHPDRDV